MPSIFFGDQSENMSDRYADNYICEKMNQGYYYAEPNPDIAHVLPIQRSHRPPDDLAFPIQGSSSFFLHWPKSTKTLVHGKQKVDKSGFWGMCVKVLPFGLTREFMPGSRIPFLKRDNRR